MALEAARQILDAEVPFHTSLGPGGRQDLGVMEEFPTLFVEIFQDTPQLLSGDSSSDFMLVLSRAEWKGDTIDLLKHDLLT